MVSEKREKKNRVAFLSPKKKRWKSGVPTFFPEKLETFYCNMQKKWNRIETRLVYKNVLFTKTSCLQTPPRT